MTTLVFSNQTLVSPLPEVAQERERCFDAITREYCPSGFVENLLALQAAQDAARILRDERLLDALESRSITALAPIFGADPEKRGSVTGGLSRGLHFEAAGTSCAEGSAKLAVFLCKRATPAGNTGRADFKLGFDRRTGPTIYRRTKLHPVPAASFPAWPPTLPQLR